MSVSRGGEKARIFLGVVIDNSDFKWTEEALGRVAAEGERRKKLYQAVLSATPDLVYARGLNHRFADANESLLQMWGKS